MVPVEIVATHTRTIRRALLIRMAVIVDQLRDGHGKGLCKVKKFQKSQQKLDRAQPTHPPPIQFVLETHQ